MQSVSTACLLRRAICASNPETPVRNMEEVNLEQRLRETVARGYCDDKNCNKELDSDLLNSIVHEIMLSLDPSCHPSRKLPLAPVAEAVLPMGPYWHPGDEA